MASWVKPTGYVDADNNFDSETYVYDGNLATKTISNPDIPAKSWGSFLELTHAAMWCDKVRFYALYESAFISQIDVDAYYGGVWNNVYSGSFANSTWVEKTLASPQIITAFRFRFYNNSSTASTLWFYEVDFEGTDSPTVTSQAVSDILASTATGNGNITATGGEAPTKRGICYNTTGTPTVADSKVEETGSFTTGAFTEALTGLTPGTTYYVKAYAYNSAGYAYGAEVNFTTDKVAPTVTVQAPTSVLPTTATANGNITALGGENSTVRGFEYGLTKTGTWDIHTHGSYSTGAFTASLTSLTANTSYWIRAYATNSIGTSYSEWIQFQTAASGVIPTGTKLDICSDYSGYTYQLQRSETDDGDVYTAYFVISTDLTNKQGLAFYKRIYDLHLYFNGYDGGTVTVYVKRDSELTWQSVGTITLDDDEDIIIEHLACDLRGKHFLFKLSAANHFEFLGCLYEFIRDGMR
jgi:hypothetical protein